MEEKAPTNTLYYHMDLFNVKECNRNLDVMQVHSCYLPLSLLPLYLIDNKRIQLFLVAPSKKIHSFIHSPIHSTNAYCASIMYQAPTEDS